VCVGCWRSSFLAAFHVCLPVPQGEGKPGAATITPIIRGLHAARKVLADNAAPPSASLPRTPWLFEGI
jgi:hypothetical protein